MRVIKSLKLRKYKAFFATIFIMTGINISVFAQDRNLDAGFLMAEMPLEQRYAFVNGVLEGLAYARFLQDKPDERGMVCIQAWLFNKESDRWKTVEAAFTKHQDKPPSVLLYLLTKKECGR